MCQRIDEIENDRIKIARYCESKFRQKTSFPQSFIDASYDDLEKFLHRQGAQVEEVFLEIFLEETPDPLDGSK